jgi:hypothetical protein
MGWIKAKEFLLFTEILCIWYLGWNSAKDIKSPENCNQ